MSKYLKLIIVLSAFAIVYLAYYTYTKSKLVNTYIFENTDVCILFLENTGSGEQPITIATFRCSGLEKDYSHYQTYSDVMEYYSKDSIFIDSVNTPMLCANRTITATNKDSIIIKLSKNKFCDFINADNLGKDYEQKDILYYRVESTGIITEINNL